MDATGTIIAVMQPTGGTSQRTGNTWMKQEYVLEIPAQYPRRISFSIFGEDRIKQFNIQQGEDLTIHFDIDAHEYNGRWFNEVRAYNVVRGQVQQPMTAAPIGAPQATPFPPAGAAASFPPAQESAAEGSADDLPF